MSEKVWYFAEGREHRGPMELTELVSLYRSGTIGDDTLVFKQGMQGWEKYSKAVGASPLPSPAPTTAESGSRSGFSGTKCHEIDYALFGNEMQFVEVELDPSETVIAEAGSLMFMENGIQMETRFGDGSEPDKGVMGKVFEGFKRKLTGESLFMTWFTNRGSAKSRVAFGAPYPGKIVPLNLADIGNQLICQKDSFLCAAFGTKVGIAFNKRIGVGLFGGEGFIMQRLEGDGMAFVHAGGTIVEKDLAAGETLRIDTGCIVAYTASVSYDIQMVKGLKSMVFGGEGMFLATLTGPGHVWLQSLPFSRLADRILAAAPAHGGSSQGEGSVLGGLGRFIGGD